MMIFYKHECEYGTPLAEAGVNVAFIAYDDRTGETAFFNVCPTYDSDIIPFNETQMKIVEQRYHDWCIANPDKATASCDKSIVMFDKDAYHDFMRGL